MGNLSFLIPTEKIDTFTISDISAILSKYNMTIHNDRIRIETAVSDLVCEIWEEKCSLNRISGVDKTQSIAISYGYDISTSKIRTEIIDIIGKHYGCYWLDEGVGQIVKIYGRKEIYKKTHDNWYGNFNTDEVALTYLGMLHNGEYRVGGMIILGLKKISNTNMKLLKCLVI